MPFSDPIDTLHKIAALPTQPKIHVMKKVWRSRNLSSKGSEAPQARVLPRMGLFYLRPPASPSGTRPESAANADEMALRKACNRTFRGRNLAYSYSIIFLDAFIGCDILLSCKRNTKSHRHLFSFGNLWLLLFIVLLQACAGLC